MNRLNEEEMKSIIAAIQNGIKEDYIDFKKSNNLTTFNCGKSAKWDLIYTNLMNKLDSTKFEKIYMSRKIWDFVAIIDKETKILYILTRKANFFKVQQGRKKRKHPHYIDGFATLNSQIDLGGQIDLFGLPKEFETNEIDEILDLLKVHRDEVSGFNVISFDEISGDLIEVTVYEVDKYLNITAEYSASEYIEPHYSTENELMNSISMNDKEEDDNFINIGIKNKKENNLEIKPKNKKEKKEKTKK